MTLVAVNCSERKKPPTSSTAIMTANAVCGVNSPQAAVSALAIRELTMRMRRKPKRRMIRAAKVFMVNAPTAAVNVTSPDSSGV